MKSLALLGAGIAMFAASSSFANYFDLQVSSCYRDEKTPTTVVCSGLVRNSSATSKHDLITPQLCKYGEGTDFKTNTRMYSYGGDVFNTNLVKFGQYETSATKSCIGHRIPGKLPVKFSVSFKNVQETIEAAGRVDFVVQPDKDQEKIIVSVEDIAID